MSDRKGLLIEALFDANQSMANAMSAQAKCTYEDRLLITRLRARLQKNEEAIDSMRAVIATSPEDWSTSSHRAWIFHVVLGWGECLEELAAKYGWEEDGRHRAEEYRQSFAEVDEDECQA
jgi:hypothetical protein